MTTLASLLDDTAAMSPERTAVVCGDVRMTYAQVNAEANKVANMLVTRGIQPGDNVALSCPNVPYFPIIYYGILKAGASVVPLNILLKGREVTYHLKDSNAKAYFCFQGTSDLPIGKEGYAGFSRAPDCGHFFAITADPSVACPFNDALTLDQALSGQPEEFSTVEVEGEETAVILYTSGTTGQPKGAELTHSNMLSNALVCLQVFDADEARPDTFMCVLPLFHSFGQTVVQNAAFAQGGTLVMLPRFEAEAASKMMVEEKVTFFAGVPTMYWRLLVALDESGIDATRLAATLRVAASGGAALPLEVHREFEQRFEVTIMEGYGLSETSPVASFAPWGEAVRAGSIGRPVAGVEMKLIRDDWSEAPAGEVGEIAIKGPNVMKGYYGRPEATAEAIREDWFRSGDLARLDEDGYYYIVDRAKDMIIRGGYNVYPREVEDTLLQHPEVSLAAVIGIPHDSHGEEIKAVVIRSPGSGLTENALLAWAKERMAAHKYPRVVEFRDCLPMTATGKILKRELN